MAEDTKSIADQLAQLYHTDTKGERRWLSYHLADDAVTPFGKQLLVALAVIEQRLPHAGTQLVRELADIRYVPTADDRSAWQAGFEQLVQKFAEILVARVLLEAEWPAGTIFAFEPLNPVTGARPEILIDTPDRQWLFEVKCPAFIDYQMRRAMNGKQLPVRGPLGALPGMREGATLPRDNVFKDFLASAERKFTGFTAKDRTGILVVVWDGYMFEATSALSHAEAGLLTENSWHVDAGARVAFEAVDGVIVLNHLEILKVAAQGKFKPRREDAFTIGGDGQPPNVWCPNLGRGDIDPHIAKVFDASHFEGVAMAAEYAPMDFVTWIDPDAASRVAGRRRRRTALLNGAARMS
ncbi:MAG TPA: hypothetical protein VHG29_05665 [Novosphingobium sp.]|nr:hypothetical protein [Novosphingobium sp.]